MNKITGITSDPYQQQQIILPDGSTFLLTMRFVPMQLGWFIPEISYTPKIFLVEGMRIVTSPNLLHQYLNLIPFGLGCFTTDNREPTQQQDFSSGYANLFVLTSNECVEYAELLADG